MMMTDLIDLYRRYRDEAYDHAQKFGMNIHAKLDFHTNRIDAFRHAYASAEMTREYGENWADIAGRLHEFYDDLFTEQNANAKNMDLWNNAVGRDIGKTSKSSDDSAQRVYDALNNGDLIVDPKTDDRRYGEDNAAEDDEDDERDGGGGAGGSAQPGETFPDMTGPTDANSGSTAGDSGGWSGSLGGLLGNLLSNIFSAIGNFLRETLASINPRTDSEETAPDAPLENTPAESGTPSAPESTEPDVPPESGEAEAPAASENPAENPATGNAAPPAENGNPSGNGAPSTSIFAPAFDDSSFSIPSGILDYFPEAPDSSSQGGQSTDSASESGGGSSPSSSGILDYSPAAPGGSFSGDSPAGSGAGTGDPLCDPGNSYAHPMLDAYGNPVYEDGLPVYCPPGDILGDDIMGEFDSGGYPDYSDFMDNPAGWDSDYMGGSGGDLASMDDSGYSDPAGWDSDAWGPDGGGCAVCNWHTGDICDWVSGPGCDDGNCMC
jgi:hypothetical protein